LKQLQETYLGKVDVIYIDPPYNTGNDFVYKDDFKSTINEYTESSGQYDEEGNRLETNSETHGRFHTNWLNMMYPRLKLARNLLSNEGIIFISIDDNEQANLKKSCDEIFGESNFITTFIIDKTAQGANQSKTFKTQHEYLLMYKRQQLEKINYDIEIDCDISKFKYEDDKGRYAITNSFDSINSPLISNKNRCYTIYYNDSLNEAIVRDEYNKKMNTFEQYNDDLIKKGYVPIRPGVRNGTQYPWNWMKERFEKYYKKE